MKRTRTVLTALMIAAMMVSVGSMIAAQDSARPNIVLIMAEDIGNDLACYGTDGVKTPILDKLADSGIRYTRFYTNSPICSPSRTALMLGMYQTSSNGHNHRSRREGCSGTALPDPLSAASRICESSRLESDQAQKRQDGYQCTAR